MQVEKTADFFMYECFMNEWSADKSVMLPITGQEDVNTNVLTTPGHILSSSCDVLSAVTYACCV